MQLVLSTAMVEITIKLLDLTLQTIHNGSNFINVQVQLMNISKPVIWPTNKSF